MLSEAVLRLCSQIPKGKVTTYKEIGRALESKAYRAIGQALRHNPHPITVPCHRVVCADGRVGGYAGKKDSNKKKKLLESEGISVQNRKVKDIHLVLHTF